MANLIDAFGQEWAEKHEATKIKPSNNTARIDITGGLKRSIIKAIKGKMKPDQPQMMYPTENDYFHIVLVQAWPTFEAKPLPKFGVGINFKWGKRWMSAAMSEEFGKLIQSDQYYVLVGKLTMKQGTKPGVMFNNFSAYGIITMEDLAEYKDDNNDGEEGTTADSE